jgi:hypothetical protein
MAFEIGKTFNGGAEWLCNSTLVYGTLRNPVVTALLITALALTIIYVMYKEDLKGSGWRRGAKAGIWLTIGVSALVFVHYYALERSMRKGESSRGVRDTMASIHHSASATRGYPVLGGDFASEFASDMLVPQTNTSDFASDDDAGDGNTTTRRSAYEAASDEGAAPQQNFKQRPNNVMSSHVDAARGVHTSAMEELGLQRVVLSSAAHPRSH